MKATKRKDLGSKGSEEFSSVIVLKKQHIWEFVRYFHDKII